MVSSRKTLFLTEKIDGVGAALQQYFFNKSCPELLDMLYWMSAESVDFNSVDTVSLIKTYQIFYIGYNHVPNVYNHVTNVDKKQNSCVEFLVYRVSIDVGVGDVGKVE